MSGISPWPPLPHQYSGDNSHSICAQPSAGHVTRWREAVAVSVGVSDSVFMFKRRPKGTWHTPHVPLGGGSEMTSLSWEALPLSSNHYINSPGGSLAPLPTALPAGADIPFHREGKCSQRFSDLPSTDSEGLLSNQTPPTVSSRGKGRGSGP